MCVCVCVCVRALAKCRVLQWWGQTYLQLLAPVVALFWEVNALFPELNFLRACFVISVSQLLCIKCQTENWHRCHQQTCWWLSYCFLFNFLCSVNKLLDRSMCNERTPTACWFVEEPVRLVITRGTAETAFCHTQSLLSCVSNSLTQSFCFLHRCPGLECLIPLLNICVSNILSVLVFLICSFALVSNTVVQSLCF